MKTPKFEFHDYNIPVEIAGRTYTLDCSTDTGDYMAGVGKRLRELAAEIASGSKTAEDAIEYGRTVLDHLFGSGAAAEIFAGRRARVSDVADLCVWLMQTANEYQRERQKQLEQKLVLKKK